MFLKIYVKLNFYLFRDKRFQSSVKFKQNPASFIALQLSFSVRQVFNLKVVVFIVQYSVHKNFLENKLNFSRYSSVRYILNLETSARKERSASHALHILSII